MVRLVVCHFQCAQLQYLACVTPKSFGFSTNLTYSHTVGVCCCCFNPLNIFFNLHWPKRQENVDKISTSIANFSGAGSNSALFVCVSFSTLSLSLPLYLTTILSESPIASVIHFTICLAILTCANSHHILSENGAIFVSLCSSLAIPSSSSVDFRCGTLYCPFVHIPALSLHQTLFIHVIKACFSSLYCFLFVLASVLPYFRLLYISRIQTSSFFCCLFLWSLHSQVAQYTTNNNNNKNCEMVKHIAKIFNYSVSMAVKAVEKFHFHHGTKLFIRRVAPKSIWMMWRRKSVRE